ncbi:hypothetical protein BDN71DRAFT_1431900 [Pleurotus eryngii]|uniref:Uncharacterized protein n=1 Tax=Pleurotus eryngii TaxID=5323 RepID=A0A9P5ZUW3_PLEER|nr:hypothetical protein BDN71DRAFT_1431900 [Pleurotus eryngii]
MNRKMGSKRAGAPRGIKEITENYIAKKYSATSSESTVIPSVAAKPTHRERPWKYRSRIKSTATARQSQRWQQAEGAEVHKTTLNTATTNFRPMNFRSAADTHQIHGLSRAERRRKQGSAGDAQSTIRPMNTPNDPERRTTSPDTRRTKEKTKAVAREKFNNGTMTQQQYN